MKEKSATERLNGISLQPTRSDMPDTVIPNEPKVAHDIWSLSPNWPHIANGWVSRMINGLGPSSDENMGSSCGPINYEARESSTNVGKRGGQSGW
jgi:hypothetical protein